MKRTAILYSLTNLPPDIESGKKRLEWLNQEHERIRIELTLRKEADFKSNHLWQQWNWGTKKVLTEVKTEKKFLIPWLRNNGVKELERKPNPEIEKKIKQLEHLAKEAVEKVGYVQTFGGLEAPESLDVADARRLKLEDCLQQLVLQSDALKKIGSELGLNNGIVGSAIICISQVSKIVEYEFAFLGRCIKRLNREASAKNPQPSSDPRLGKIQSELSIIKAELSMQNSEMLVFLADLVRQNRIQMMIPQLEEQKLNSILRYAELTQKRIEIEFPA